MEPLSTTTTDITICPENAGIMTLLASFYSEQTGCIRGHFRFEVHEKEIAAANNEGT